ncbi:MAG: aspartyl protease family protein [Caulobacteraceae bacterium]
MTIKPRTFGHSAPDALGRKIALSLEGHVLEAIVHREPGAPPEDGVPPFFEAGALIDTGASDVCIDFRLAHALKLRQIDQRTVGTLGGSVLANVYLGILEIPALDHRKLMPLLALRVARVNYSVILGRSFLSDYIVTFDGPNGCCHFIRAEDAYPPPPDDE